MITAVIMAGGRGERFWPKSRVKNPKQVLPIVSSKPMIRETVDRILPLIPIENIYLVIGENLFLRVAEEIPELADDNIVLEPVGKNTASAIGLAAVRISKVSPDAVMVVLSADHMIGDDQRFHKFILAGERLALEKASLVTMGIKPTRPETGYGYIEAGREIFKEGDIHAYGVKAFTEKPDEKKAKKFVKSRKFLWNSGMFIWQCKAIMNAFKEYMPELYGGLKEIEASLGKENYNSTVKKVYASLEKISIDYGVMEKAHNRIVLESDFLWDDIGDWAAMERVHKKDKDGNILLGEVENIDSKDCIFISDDGLVGAVNLKDLIVVKCKDTVLVADKSKAQEVKKLVEKLSKKEEFKKYL